jgi:hypothetical protein
MPNTFSLIASSTVGAGGAANIDFTSIPSTYTDLCLKISIRCDETSFPDLVLGFNNSTANMTRRLLYTDNGTSALSYTDSQSNPGWVNGSTTTSSTFINSEIYIPNYAGSTVKSFSADSVAETNATAARLGLFADLWNQTVAINRVTVSAGSGNLVQYSTAYLYGIVKS